MELSVIFEIFLPVTFFTFFVLNEICSLYTVGHRIAHHVYTLQDLRINFDNQFLSTECSETHYS